MAEPLRERRVVPGVPTFEIFDGCYEAARAAQLSGVPLSTVYDWARKGVVEPSVSQDRVKLWSYADLMALRITSWLRHPKADGAVPAASMKVVRAALDRVRADRDLWAPSTGSPIAVDRSGTVYIDYLPATATTAHGQQVLDDEMLDLLGPFELEGQHGPDLVRPRPHLRIVPGKVSGEPHLVGTRLTSPTVAALDRRGFTLGQILEMYPSEEAAGIRDAVDLERALASAA